MLLNIDELIGEPKKIVFGGKEYAVTMMIPGLDVQKVPARALAPLFSFLMGADEKNSQTAQTPQGPTQI